MMNRKSFIKQTAAITPMIVAFNPLAAVQKRFLGNLLSKEKLQPQNRILVLIQLNGGNDGLNTVIPLDKYKILSVARPSLLIPERHVLKLNDSQVFGFHPALTSLQSLYNNKQVAIIQNVGYPNPSFSHFHGINIKYTANTDKDEVKSGWVGRYLEKAYPNYPTGYPTHKDDGPPSIRIGMVSPRIAEGLTDDLSVGITNIHDFNFTSSASNQYPVSNDLAGMNIDIVRAVSKQIELYAPTIQVYAKRQNTLSKLYPEAEKNELADQLKMVAKLIGGGLNSRIYVVSQTGYDTHGDQVDRSDASAGKHASLLKDLSEAIVAFQDDLELMGKQDEVIGMTFSEFGRRIAASDSYGTDHGTAESVILFGSKVKNGIVGDSPELPATINGDDNLPIQYDFRSLYASVLSGWFGMHEDAIANVITQGPKERLDLFRP